MTATNKGPPKSGGPPNTTNRSTTKESTTMSRKAKSTEAKSKRPKRECAKCGESIRGRPPAKPTRLCSICRRTE